MNVREEIGVDIAKIGWLIDVETEDSIKKILAKNILHPIVTGVNRGGGNSCREFIATLK